MTLCIFIAIALSVLTDAAVSRPALASVAVARDSRRAQRVRQTTVRFARNGRARRPWVATITVRRILAPLTGAASPRAPARVC
ncbi:MAG TPA: hypothetical protein VGD79_04815 [Thermoanaerobaculia bacterium]|jgi:hypothetical protein